MLRGNRFRLVTLGRLTLIGAAGEEDASLAKRRRKLAVLAVLALARRPLSRDALLVMFWGEQDEARARHSLSNALSSLRRALGQRSITTRDEEVGLAADVPLDVDALELSEAVEGRDYARAVGLYGGSFLAGVYVEDSAAFEQWVSRERRRLDALFLTACAQQCAVLARTRRWPECGTLAARWLDTDPLSADAALFLINAAKAPGTRSSLAQALNDYERYRQRLGRDFNLAPDKNVSELAERIREELATAPEPAAQPIVATPPPSPEPHVAAEAAEQTPASVFVTGAYRVVRQHALWRGVGVAAVLAVIAFTLFARQSPSSTPGAGGAGKPVIAVLAMDLRVNDAALAWLAEGLPQMINGKLARIDAVEIVPPDQVRALLTRSGHAGGANLTDVTARDLASRVGATLVARGAISRDGSKLVLDLTVHDVASGELVRDAVLTRDDALALADEAAARIVGAANVSVPGPQLAELETSSLEAYQYYIRALEAGKAGLRSEAIRALDAALALDSGFITVLRDRSYYALVDNDSALVRRLRETMRQFANRATEFDRLHQEASDAFYAGERERSQALARGLVRRYPRDPRAYQLLQGVLTMHGLFAEAERFAVQALALDSLAMRAGSGPCAACSGFTVVVGLHWSRNDLRGAADWARRWIREQPDAATAWAALAWTFSYMQLPDSALPLMQRAVSLSGGDQWATAEYARMLLVARRYAAADSVINVLEGRTDAGESQSAADLRSLLEREHGRMREASLAIGRLQASPNSSGFAQMIQADNERLLGDFASAVRRYEALVHAPNEAPPRMPFPPQSARALCWHHALVADVLSATGDTIALSALADTLEQGCSNSYYARDWRLHHHVRGLIAMRRGWYAEAERQFLQAVSSPVEGWSRTTVELAKAQAAQNGPLRAIATLRTAYATRLDAMGRYVPISELDFYMAQMFAQAGERDSARTYAAYVRSAWRNADPEIRRLLAKLP